MIFKNYYFSPSNRKNGFCKYKALKLSISSKLLYSNIRVHILQAVIIRNYQSTKKSNIHYFQILKDRLSTGFTQILNVINVNNSSKINYNFKIPKNILSLQKLKDKINFSNFQYILKWNTIKRNLKEINFLNSKEAFNISKDLTEVKINNNVIPKASSNSIIDTNNLNSQTIKTSTNKIKINKYNETTVKSSSIVEQVTSKANAAADVVKNLSSYLPSIPYADVKNVNVDSLILNKVQKLPPQINIEEVVENIINKNILTSKKNQCLIDFCEYLIYYQDYNDIHLQKKMLPALLTLRHHEDDNISSFSKCALRLVGYIDPPTNQGIRILSIDGGGTRGLMVIEMLKKLEQLSGQRIHQLFDYVCGVSTGSLIALICSAFRVPLTEVESIYKTFSVKMFDRNKFIGAGKLFTSHAFYDSLLWENILSENIGNKTFIDTMKDSLCPKFSVVSTLADTPHIQNFLFCNYVNSPLRASHYMRSIDNEVWQAIRASTAAPGYFEDYQLDGHIHQDGGVLTNNPAAVALHECRMLWPSENIQCIISLGTGRHERFEPLYKQNLKSKVNRIVESATDTEAVHRILQDLLPANSYFRFNTYLSQEYTLDEVNEERWNDMYSDVEMYMRKNQPQLQAAVDRLVEGRAIQQKVNDYLTRKIATLKNF